jgi:hypothetical protein
MERRQRVKDALRRTGSSACADDDGGGWGIAEAIAFDRRVIHLSSNFLAFEFVIGIAARYAVW